MSEADKGWDEAPKLPKAAKPRGRTNCWRVLALVLLPYAAFSWYSDPFELEYYGYCKKDGVTRDPQALMNKYIEAIIKEQAEAGDNYVKYSSVQDFYQNNPRCCRLYAWMRPQDYPWEWQKATKIINEWRGEARYQLTLSYKAKINDEEPYVLSSPIINTCGEAAEHSALMMKQYSPEDSAPFRFISGHLD